MNGYNPGNQNNSGQILAQSINGAVDAVAQGYQQFKQNQLLAGQATSKFDAAAQANPDMIAYLASDQANPQLKSAYTKLTTGGAVNFKDAAALSTFADSFVGAKQKRQQAQMNQAQIDDLASQARLRKVQGDVAQRNFDMLQSLLGSPDSPAAGTPAGDAASAAAQPQPTPAPGQQGSPLAPSTPPPTLKGTFIAMTKGTGQIADPRDVASAYNSAKESWNKIERPVGFVAGATTKDKDGNAVIEYYPTTYRNDGSVIREKEPIHVPVGQPPPGTLLDPKTYQPIAAPAAMQAAGVAPNQPVPPPTKEQQTEIQDAAQQLQKLVIARKQLDNLYTLNQNLNAKRGNAAQVAVMGTDSGNKLAQALGDDSGQRFDAQAAPFFSDVMANVKGLRTQQEFTKVTGKVPASGQSRGTRLDILDDARDAYDNAIKINAKALASMQAGALPSSAWANATTPDTQVVHKIFNSKADVDAAIKDGTLQAGDRGTLNGVSFTVREKK